jgi:hypothetical protein
MQFARKLTCGLPHHHALEELRFLLVGPGISRDVILRLHRARVLRRLGLCVSVGCGSCAGLGSLARRHCGVLVMIGWNDEVK